MPCKRIITISDMEEFKRSPARRRILQVIEEFSRKVIGLEVPSANYESSNPRVTNLVHIFEQCSSLMDKTPPVETPQRFGNPSYRDWLLKVEDSCKFENAELDYYFINAFGSRSRIDYGTGHELNFIAFSECYLSKTTLKGHDVLWIFHLYFSLCRKAILTYNLEPAGSHGVWGLDDHFHMPYILGAAQLAPLSPNETPRPKDTISPKLVSEFESSNLYFEAIGFINHVKKGAFFEHSPLLYDISGVKTWSKVRSGMVKMYEGEVLSSFPVVQHFYFGETFVFRESAFDCFPTPSPIAI